MMYYFRIAAILLFVGCASKLPRLEFEKTIERETIYAEWKEVPVVLDFYINIDGTVRFIVWQMSSSPFLNKIDFDSGGQRFELIPGNDRFILNHRDYDLDSFYRQMKEQIKRMEI